MPCVHGADLFREGFEAEAGGGREDLCAFFEEMQEFFGRKALGLGMKQRGLGDMKEQITALVGERDGVFLEKAFGKEVGLLGIKADMEFFVDLEGAGGGLIVVKVLGLVVGIELFEERERVGGNKEVARVENVMWDLGEFFFKKRVHLVGIGGFDHNTLPRDHDLAALLIPTVKLLTKGCMKRDATFFFEQAQDMVVRVSVAKGLKEAFLFEAVLQKLFSACWLAKVFELIQNAHQRRGRKDQDLQVGLDK